MSNSGPEAAWRSMPMLRKGLYTLGAFRGAWALAPFVPRPLGHVIARSIARVAARTGTPAFQTIQENLRVVTGLHGAALDRLTAENIGHLSTMLADYFYATCDSGGWAKRLLREWSGWEHITAAREAGRGAILVTGHLGAWELGGILLAQGGIPLTIVTLEEPSAGLTRLRDAYRRRLGIKTLEVGPGREFAIVELIKLLERNECVAMLVDRPYHGSGLPVRFFGAAAEFSSAPALLWQHTGAAVVPAFVVRDPRGGYVSFAEPPLTMEAGPDKRTALGLNTQRIASVFESIIARFPEQWFNYVPAFPRSTAP